MALTRPRYSNIVDTDYKASCRVVTTTNITLSGGAPSTYDGVSLLVGDRILVTGQNTANQNGIYAVQTLGSGSNGTWARTIDANDGERLTAGLQTSISEGTYAGKAWRLTTPDPITVGSTSLTFLESTTIAAGANRNLQFNNSTGLSGATGLNYYTGNLALVASGNIHATANLIAGAVYTDQLLWQGNNQPVTLTGNINPTIYVGNTQVSTAATVVDTLPASGNAYVRWNIVTKDQVNSRYRFVTIESVNDTVDVYYNEYGSVKSNAAFEVAEFTSNITSGNINLWATGDSDTVYVNFQRTMLGSYAPTGYINNFGPRGPAGTIAETSSNIVTTATSAATSTTTGALQVAGGAGIAGNAYIGGNAVVGTDLTVIGNLYVQGVLTRIDAAILSVEDLNITLANGAATSGAANGAGISVDGPAGAQIVYIASGDRWNLNKDTKVNNLYSGGIYWSGNNAVLRTGINYYTSSAAPADANYGDKWYDTTTDILYEWQTGDGATGFWVDVGSLAIIANANLSNQAFNTVSANNINSTGNITASNVVLGGVGSGSVYANNFIFSQNGASIFDSFGVNSYGNVNVGQYLPKHTGNLQAANVYVVGNDSLNNTSGALRVVGGVGISGNLNLYNASAGGYFANISGWGRPSSGVQSWQFFANPNIGGQSSWILFPDGTTQYTAYPGSATSISDFTAFQTYANTKIGTSSGANLVVSATTSSTGATTGALVVAGGAGFAGNIWSANAYIGSNTDNYIKIAGGVSPATPTITALGSDASVGINVYTKGISGIFGVYTNSVKQFDVYGPVNTVSWVRASGAATGAAPYIQAAGSATDIDIAVSAKNDGNVVITGGNVTTSLTGNINLGANLRVYSSVGSTSTATGALVVQGGAGVAGNLNLGNYTNLYMSSGTLNNQAALNLVGNVTGKSGAGAGYHDFMMVQSTNSAITNGQKWFRVNQTGGLEIVNSGFTTTLFRLEDNGDLIISGNVTQNGIKTFYSSARPGFRVYGSGTTNNLNTSVNTTGALNSNNWTVEFNQGSYLNSSTGVFTAPVAGLYQTNMVVRNSGNTTSIMQASIVKNATGGNGAGGSISVMVEFAANSSMNHAGGGTILSLAVGDTLALKVTAGTINFDPNDNWSVAYLG